MRGRHSLIQIKLDAETRKQLQAWLRQRHTLLGLAKRAHAILLLADGRTFTGAAAQVGLSERHVHKWARRFLKQGVEGLKELPRPGRSTKFCPSMRTKVEDEQVKKQAVFALLHVCVAAHTPLDPWHQSHDMEDDGSS
jgi:hypothetical protein